MSNVNVSLTPPVVADDAATKAYTDALVALLASTLTSVTHKYTQLIGDGTATNFTIAQTAHGLGNDPLVAVHDAASGDLVDPDIAVNHASGLVTIAFAAPPASNAYRVVLVG